MTPPPPPPPAPPPPPPPGSGSGSSSGSSSSSGSGSGRGSGGRSGRAKTGLPDDGPLAEITNFRFSPISDSNVLFAFDRAVLVHGPARLTLRHIAEECRLSPPTLLQRFGSKKALHEASARRRARREKKPFRDEGGDPLAIVLRGFQLRASWLTDPTHAAHMIALHHLELADPVLGPIVREGARQRRRALRSLLDRALAEERLLPDTATGRLAHALEAAYRGALTGWVTFQTRSAGRWIGREVRRTLAPHRS
ncbi:TetR/AcrR family transcriptional regulator [Gemmatimonadota bacterium DH-20]|uniref:TetR/AcrR family transcriptional regulator n=1 Tax=Gaopeijia maritima TaxID=3119007 RepID=A0ABU9E400_9BACT